MLCLPYPSYAAVEACWKISAIVFLLKRLRKTVLSLADNIEFPAKTKSFSHKLKTFFPFQTLIFFFYNKILTFSEEIETFSMKNLIWSENKSFPGFFWAALLLSLVGNTACGCRLPKVGQVGDEFGNVTVTMSCGSLYI